MKLKSTWLSCVVGSAVLVMATAYQLRGDSRGPWEFSMLRRM